MQIFGISFSVQVLTINNAWQDAADTCLGQHQIPVHLHCPNPHPASNRSIQEIPCGKKTTTCHSPPKESVSSSRHPLHRRCHLSHPRSTFSSNRAGTEHLHRNPITPSHLDDHHREPTRTPPSVDSDGHPSPVRLLDREEEVVLTLRAGCGDQSLHYRG